MSSYKIISGVSFLAVLFGLLSSFSTVDQTQQALILQFGEPKRLINKPGLNFKIPFIQEVTYFDKRVLSLVSKDSEEVILADQKSFLDIYIKHFDHVATMFQMLIFSGLTFFLFLPMLRPTQTISIDFDWFYRKGAKIFYYSVDKAFNSINRAAEKLVIKTFLPALVQFIITAPVSITKILLRPIWQESLSADKSTLKKQEKDLTAKFSSGTFPVAYSAIFILIFIGLLIFLGNTSN